MNTLFITQEDFFNESQRLLEELRSGNHTNKRIAGICVTAQLESFFRIYYCCVGLAIKSLGADRMSILWEAHTFLKNLEGEICKILNVTLESSEMQSFRIVLTHLGNQLTPMGEINSNVEPRYTVKAAFCLGEPHIIKVDDHELLSGIKKMLHASPISTVEVTADIHDADSTDAHVVDIEPNI